MAQAVWHLLTPEFPPQVGGVADYSYLIARGLTEAGDEVHVWCPTVPTKDTSSSDGMRSPNGFRVHQQLGRIRPSELQQAGRMLDRFPGPRRLLVQWVPHGYGYRSMNLPFCFWLWARSAVHGDRVDIMVHEPYLRFWGGSWRQTVAACVHRLMTVALLRAANRVWVAIPDWEALWRPYALGRRVPFRWLPVPSCIGTCEAGEAGAIHERIAGPEGLLLGYFGTYGPAVSTLLLDLLPRLLGGRFDPVVLLLGAGSQEFHRRLVQAHPQFEHRVQAPGYLPTGKLSNHLAACDVLIQPYPDGISSRRTSALAGLSLGRPIVTTSGRWTEPLWAESGAVLLADVVDCGGFVSHVERLLADPTERQHLALKARALYDGCFDLSHAIAALRRSSWLEPDCGEEHGAP